MSMNDEMEKASNGSVTVGESIRVLIVDDHDMVRKGLGVFLKARPGFLLVGEARDGVDAVAQCARLAPDERPQVVLMDLKMPRMGGVAATRELLQRYPQMKIVALTSFQEKELVKEALQAGALSYILKDVSADELANVIRNAYAGKSTLAPEATQALVQAALAGPAPGDDLTRREREVLALMVAGMNNNEIAQRLVVSQATSKAHVSNILSKLGVTNRAEAIALALRRKLVD